MVLAVYFAVQVAVALLVSSVYEKEGPDAVLTDFATGNTFTGFSFSVSLVAATLICSALTILLIRFRGGMSAGEYLSLRAIGGKELIIWLPLTVAVMLAFGLLTRALNRPVVPELWAEAYRTAHLIALFYFATVVAGPVFEEVLFRGFFFRGIEHSSLGTAGAILLSALYWSAIHIQYDLFDMSQVFVLGLIFGAARARTRSLYVTIAMHVFNNLGSMLELSYYAGQ
jgi:membrane protease YdiL (CAAX protease family)